MLYVNANQSGGVSLDAARRRLASGGGFIAGYLLFIAIGSSPSDAVFSALSLAALVAAWRVLTQPSL